MDYDDDILLQDAPGDNVDDLDVCIDETVVSKDFEYLLSKDTPEVDSWKDDDITAIDLSVDGARQHVLDQAVAEFEHIRGKCAQILGTRNPTAEELIEYFFGRDSSVYGAFKQEVDSHKVGYNTFRKCIGMFLLCCRYGEKEWGIRDMFQNS